MTLKQTADSSEEVGIIVFITFRSVGLISSSHCLFVLFGLIVCYIFFLSSSFPLTLSGQHLKNIE